MKTQLDRHFEQLAREFLAAHSVQHEWREIRKWYGDRTDLVCGVGQPNEVFATLNGTQLTVGRTKDSHYDDFEDFDSDRSDEEIAREAFERFVELLREHGHVGAAA